MLDAPIAQAIEPGWTADALRGRCRILRDTCHARGVSDPELEAIAPGGAENPTADPFGALVVWYALLRARLAVEDIRRQDREARSEAAVADALANTPVPVRLSIAERSDAPRAVYPKSYHALRFCDALDAALREVVATAAALETADGQALGLLSESLAVRLWAWILTDPSPGLPFDEGAPPEPPEWTRALNPDDLLALLAAHLEVNRVRIVRIAQLFPAERARESRLSLAGFLGTVAQELHQRPAAVLRAWSLGEAFAQAATASQSAREAREAAEQSARERRAS